MISNPLPAVGLARPAASDRRYVSEPRERFRFAPDIGRWRIALVRLVQRLQVTPDGFLDELQSEAHRIAGSITDGPWSHSTEQLRYAFALSLIHDIVRAGGELELYDSEILISWPDWDSANGRDLARHALGQLADTRPMDRGQRQRMSELFAPSLDETSVSTFLANARFWLESVDAVHPSGVRYAEAFSIGLRLWNMPYRGREGRLRRFVVVGQDSSVAPNPLVVGLIEIGDDAPYSTLRDQFLSLRVPEMLQWLDSQPSRSVAAGNLAQRLSELRQSLLPISDIDPTALAEDIAHDHTSLLERAAGRSRVGADLAEKKRITYLIRLAMGEQAFKQLATGRVDQSDPNLREGVRAIHDLSVPRVHMDVTVCGALPPFTAGLAGKLVVSFLSHPLILDCTRHSQSSIVKTIFNLERLIPQLPNHGLLVVTTKGLYPGHSALYNRCELPGVGQPMRLRKIGDTVGTTTALLSDRTGKLAIALSASRIESAVSTVYGTGGAKRQRLIESAVLASGLPERFVHAGIRRPMYGVRFADNVPDVLWGLAQPSWLTLPGNSASEYSEAATRLWRKRWLSTAERRLSSHNGLIPSVSDLLS